MNLFLKLNNSFLPSSLINGLPYLQLLSFCFIYHFALFSVH